MTRISFRHGDETTARGNVLFYDGAVELMEIDDARNPALWFPRGTSLRRIFIPEPYRSSLPDDVEALPAEHSFVQRVIIW